MLFLYGSLMEDVSYYDRAWKLSEETYYYAMNGLGRHALANKDPKKAVECFETSLKINHFQIKIWFQLGITYMRDFKDFS